MADSTERRVGFFIFSRWALPRAFFLCDHASAGDIASFLGICVALYNGRRRGGRKRQGRRYEISESEERRSVDRRPGAKQMGELAAMHRVVGCARPFFVLCSALRDGRGAR